MTGAPDVRLCLVTDPGLAAGRPIEAIAAAAAKGGATLVQLRDKAAPARALLALARRVKEALAPYGVPLVVNDRADVAFAAGAGVHLGQGDLPADAARALLGAAAVVGLSIEHAREVDAVPAGAVAYLAASPVFATPTKTDTKTPFGLDGLARLRARTRLPLIAIGGIDAGNAADVCAAGADGVAVVSAIMAAPDPEAAARTLRRAADDGLDARMRRRA